MLAMEMLGWTPVSPAAELAPGDGALFEARGVAIAIYRRGERFHAVGAICPHAGSLLSEFATDEGTALCPSHGWEFRLEDGGCTNERTQRVPVYPLRVVDGFLWVKVRPVRAAIADFLRGGRRRGSLSPAPRLR
jgi:nitrite reductase (NADH) small subunit